VSGLAVPRPQKFSFWVSAPALLLAGLGLLMALMETRLPTIAGLALPVEDVFLLGTGLLVLLVLLRTPDGAASIRTVRTWRMSAVIGLAFGGCLVAGLVGKVGWPNSGDEYSYLFLADLLLHGRIAAAPPPDPVLFTQYHVLVHGGRLFSPYAPGWSMLLAPFRAVGAETLVNPLLTALLGLTLAGALARLGIGSATRGAAVALVLLVPFTLFLGGSFFPQTLAAATVAGIVWLQLGDEAAPGHWRKIAIGAAFGLLLVTRQEVLAVAAVPYAIDRLVIRKAGVLADAAWMALGFLPFVVLQLAYDTALTGDPLMPPAIWAGSDALLVPAVSLAHRLGMAVVQDLQFTGTLAQFGGLPVAALALLGLGVRVRARTCRFWDFLLPAAILFYSFIPFSGGHQYGPRYWFWAWPVCVLSVVTGLVEANGILKIGPRRVGFEHFVACCLIATTASFAGLLMTTRVYMTARQAVFADVPQRTPAVVLLPDRWLALWPWQIAVPAPSLDFTRNDMFYSSPILYGRDDVDGALDRACRLPGRQVYRWIAVGRLEPLVCP
jgi:hypothetical protein